MLIFPRPTSSANSRRIIGTASKSRLTFTESMSISGRLAAYRRKSNIVESTIQEISICPDDLPWLTTFSSPGEVETRISAPVGSFVSHEITTQPSPNEMGFGFALIFPVIFPACLLLLTGAKPGLAFGCQRDLRLLTRYGRLRTS